MAIPRKVRILTTNFPVKQLSKKRLLEEHGDPLGAFTLSPPGIFLCSSTEASMKEEVFFHELNEILFRLFGGLQDEEGNFCHNAFAKWSAMQHYVLKSNGLLRD